jgi:hypothetical protein
MLKLAKVVKRVPTASKTSMIAALVEGHTQSVLKLAAKHGIQSFDQISQ